MIIIPTVTIMTASFLWQPPDFGVDPVAYQEEDPELVELMLTMHASYYCALHIKQTIFDKHVGIPTSASHRTCMRCFNCFNTVLSLAECDRLSRGSEKKRMNQGETNGKFPTHDDMREAGYHWVPARNISRETLRDKAKLHDLFSPVLEYLMRTDEASYALADHIRGLQHDSAEESQVFADAADAIEGLMLERHRPAALEAAKSIFAWRAAAAALCCL